jgi:Septum formation
MRYPWEYVLVAAVMTAVACGGGDAEPVDKTAFELEVGDCVRSLGDDEQQEPTLGDVEVIACDQPHRAEVYAVFDHPADQEAAYPGNEAMEKYANEQCRGPLFDSYIGGPYTRSDLLVLEATPVESTWTQGDREIVCLVHAGDQTLEKTLRGSEQ